MSNFTENRHNKPIEALYCANVLGLHHSIFLTAFNIFLSVTASLGNALILIALHKESSLHPPSKLMLRCLSITDLCVGLTTQPMFAAELIIEIHELRQLCDDVGMLVGITSVAFSGVSLMTVTAIGVDRLLALSLGLRYRQVVTKRRVGAILISVWLVCVGCPLAKRFTGFVFFSQVISIIIMLCIITSLYCYTKIYLRLRHQRAQTEDIAHQGQPNGGGIPLNIARYRKTVSAALWVQITLAACYLPYAVLLSFRTLFPFSEESYTIGMRYAGSLVLLNSSLNPFLYCWKIREMRQAVKDTVERFDKYCYKSD